MIKSMTGFGRGETISETLKINIEMKSVNHRYCEIVPHMPRSMNVFEDRIKRVIQKKIARGRVDLYINVAKYGADRVTVTVDEHLAASYLLAVKELKDKMTLAGEVTVKELLQLPGVFLLEESEEDTEQWWPELEATLQQALAGLMDMRVKEGQLLASDIKERIGRIAGLVNEIEQRSPVVVDEYRARLSQRLHDLLEPGTMDPSRLDAEVVLLAERSSITEEIVRLKSHLKQLRDCLELATPVGRKLDFILQELNREINTIASKSSDLAINSIAVEVKSELEKIREQVQNIE
ncbi:YicC/YloC family endoribonuclease [Desulfallas thermosapovorans]|uniref:Uncharacterized protein (TIGR00255 family) n=1 Tax=Desulfallas thermosapovorans DSM 6562 TaxID=1121431 RepID=A0A5S4ZWV6_9FIRM|nr:YicC/YloC family endoribonuclease [Desulfallas thermosapovorans]TYO97362.1 uncharacterized protein (TIGR00255 family) [Desulfallas thermosapovorans DSM 6562]